MLPNPREIDISSNGLYISHTASIFFPWKKFPPEGNLHFYREYYPFPSEAGYRKRYPREIRFLVG